VADFGPAKKLREHRPLLLAMEAVGWLHMAGKARTEFRSPSAHRSWLSTTVGEQQLNSMQPTAYASAD
jgi:hypothetical protein